MIQGSVCSQESADHFPLLTIEIQAEVGLISVPETRHLPGIILTGVFFYAKKLHVLASFLIRQVKLHAGIEASDEKLVLGYLDIRALASCSLLPTERPSLYCGRPKVACGALGLF